MSSPFKSSKHKTGRKQFQKKKDKTTDIIKGVAEMFSPWNDCTTYFYIFFIKLRMRHTVKTWCYWLKKWKYTHCAGRLPVRWHQAQVFSSIDYILSSSDVTYAKTHWLKLFNYSLVCCRQKWKHDLLTISRNNNGMKWVVIVGLQEFCWILSKEIPIAVHGNKNIMQVSENDPMQ